MPDYNPHDTLTVEFREVERYIGARLARQMFDAIRLERSLQRVRELAEQIAKDEHSASVAALLEHVREFLAVSNVVDTLAHAVELELDAECVACALTAGGLCPDHAAVAAG